MKSFKNYIEEAHSEWHVTFKTGHKPQRVKGRNTAEAIKKAEKRAQNSGEKDSRLKAMYKGIKKVSEEAEQIDERNAKIDRSVQDFHVNVPGHGMVLVKARSEGEAQAKAKAKFDKGDDNNDTFKEAYRKPTQAEIDADKKKDNAGKKRPSMDHKSAKKSVYKNMMGGLKNEEVELDEASFSADVTSEPGPLRRYVNTALKKGLKTKVVRHGGATEVILTGDRDVITKFLKSQKFSAKEIARGFDKMEESVELDEILDTPKAMDSYKNKAKASYSKAASSAAAKILRGKDKDGNRADHRPELKTMAKRSKGLTAADMVAVRRTFDNLRKEDITEADIAEILRQYALSENVNADQLAELTEEEINEIIGKAIGGAFKLGAKATVGAARLAKKGVNRMTVSGRADAAEKRANAAEKKNKDRLRIRKAQQRLRDAKKAARSVQP